VEEAQPQPERRPASRYAVDTELSLLIVNQGGALRARMFELGLDGCRVRADRIPGGMNAGVELTFKINGIGFRLAGTVQRLDPPQTAAIQFSSMAPRRREALEYLLDELEAQKLAEKEAEKLARAAGKPARPAPRLLPATADRSRGSARILPMPNAPACGPKRAARPTGSERREQARAAVDTQATVFLIDVRAHVSGRIVDLSMCGCRIRTNERFPVGIYRRVETEFKLDGMPFRLAGVVQAVHDKFTVGIRFLDTSQRKREQLQELMQEIAEMKVGGQGLRDQGLANTDRQQ
jgi:hypothetical protein